MKTDQALPGASRESQSFGALRVPAFQLFSVATIGISMAVWVGAVGQNWLIQELTGSPFYLGLVNFFWGLPMVALSLVGGVVADRIDRRTVLVVGRALQTIVVLLMGLLVWTGATQVWHVMVFALLQGAIMAFDIPARQALIPILVPRRHMMSAIAIHASIWGGTNIAGPALAGNLIEWLGLSGCFFLAAAANLLAAIIFFWLRRLPAQSDETGTSVLPKAAVSMVQGLIDGYRYLRGQRTIVAVFLMNIGPVVIGQAYMAIIPSYTADVLHGDAVVYSQLLSAGGVGALITTIAIAGLGDIPRKGMVVIVGGMAFGGGLLALAITGDFWLALTFQAIIGATNMMFFTVSNTLIQALLDDSMRARVTSVFQLTWGMQSAGSLMLGTIGGLIGVPAAIGLAGALSVLGVLVTLAKFPEIKKL